MRPNRLGVTHPFVSLGGRLPKGSPLQPRALHALLQRWCDKAGVARRRFHSLRHPAVLDALDEGISPDQVMKQVGHASIQTTLNYMRGRDEDRARAYREHSLSESLAKRAAKRRERLTPKDDQGTAILTQKRRAKSDDLPLVKRQNPST